MTDALTNLTPEQLAADRFAQSWFRQQGLTPDLDRIREMYRR